MEEAKLMQKFLGMLGQIKVFHWATMSYAKHKALNKLHESLSDLVDRFMEVYIGKHKSQPLKSFKISMDAQSDSSNLMKYLESERESLRMMHSQLKKETELQNILDEMMGAFSQAIYLCNLS
uniref:Uncharacterized protein n=1 Tax=viral metagenome TaxID=1070528 RepID=A0A6C0CU70_9ZZZZ